MNKVYYKNEIILHNTKEDCWVILFNQVYDISDFVKKHPGGTEILLSRAGEDASSFFQTRHGIKSPYLKHLEKYKIGELSVEERVSKSAFDEPFLDELIKTCQRKNLFKVSQQDSKKFNAIRLLLVSLFFLIVVSVYYLNIQWWWAVPLVVIQALISTSLFGLLAHEHTHNEFPKSKFLNLSLQFIWPILWPFISRKALIYEHNSHHIKIGDPEYDYEVIAFSHFIRYSGDIPHRRIHKIQHQLSFFWYMFYANIITTIGGVFTSFWNHHNKKVALSHNVSILLTFSVYFFIPMILGISFLSLLLYYLLFQCTLFTFIYIGAAINHFTPLANQPIPENMKNKFGYYVCHNTSNFAPNSMFWFYFSGGFNIQIEHHLSAFVPVENLKKLQPIVKELCTKYQYPYVEFNSMFDLYKAHYDYLYNLSKSDLNALSNNEVDNKRGFQAR
jgi:fatty acid desaturase